MAQLSKSEVNILRTFLTNPDFSCADAAKELFITENTLKRHLANIYGKLNVKTRLGAVLKATVLGLI